MKPSNVIIIGGGIGGLTLARALEQKGIGATVFEQSPELREVGAGISLWSNATSVLEKLGYGDALPDLGTKLTHGEFVSPSGNVLAHYNVADVLEHAPIEARPRLVHRGALLEMLAEGLERTTVVTGKRCEKVDWDRERPVVHFEDGTSETADLVVGADGIWSSVRASLWGDPPPRYGGEWCFRGLALGVDTDVGYLRELHGRGQRFGFGAIDGELTYWFATYATDEDFSLPREEFSSFLRERYAGWPLRIPELLGATDPERIHLDALYDRIPRSRWSRGAVTLLGDAAHPTTPNMGQGGCMAIEDAALLAELIVRADTLRDALADYERLRIPRTSKLVDESFRFGRIGQWSNPVATWLRESIIRLTPARVMKAQLLDKIAYDVLEAI